VGVGGPPHPPPGGGATFLVRLTHPRLTAFGAALP